MSSSKSVLYSHHTCSASSSLQITQSPSWKVGQEFRRRQEWTYGTLKERNHCRTDEIEIKSDIPYWDCYLIKVSSGVHKQKKRPISSLKGITHAVELLTAQRISPPSHFPAALQPSLDVVLTGKRKIIRPTPSSNFNQLQSFCLS